MIRDPIRCFLLALFTLVVPGLAQAGPITLTEADAVADLTFNRTVVGTSFPDDISANLTFTLKEWNDAADDPQLPPGDLDLQLIFDVTVDNTSDIPSVLTSIAFDTDPDAEDGSEDSAIFQSVLVDETGGFDVCVQNDTNNACFGNTGNVGISPADAAHTFQLILYFETTSTVAVDLSNFFARFQSVNGSQSDKAFELDNPQPPDVPVPEPASLVLLGTGLFAAGARRWRSTRK